MVIKMKNTTKVFIILGAQGSGKGTQAKFIAKKLHLAYFSIGEELKSIRDKNTKLGNIVKKYYDKGLLTPEKYIDEIIGNVFKKLGKDHGIIIDGYPRTLVQAKFFEKNLKQYKLGNPLVIYLKINLKTALKRIASRKLCSVCGRSYNPTEKDYRLNICQVCKKPLSIRPDDTPRAVKARLDIFNKLTKPTITYFQKKNLLLEINGEPNIKDVSKEICANFKKMGIL